MPQRVGAAPLGFHVITYVERADRKQPDVVAHGALQPVAAGAEGDATKAVLDKAENHQCDGSDGCNQVHAYAEERVIARAAEDGVGVVWRRFHPVVARGDSRPGQPFEAESDGLKVRVETRAIVDDAADVFTADTISQVAIARLEPELAQKEQQAAVHLEGAKAYQQFCAGPLHDARTRLADAQVQLKGLPSRKAEVTAALKSAAAKLDQVADDSAAELDQLMENAGPNAVQQVQGFAQKYAPAIEAAFTEVKAIQDAARALIAAQQAVNAALEQANALVARADQATLALPGLDLKGVGHDKLQLELRALAASCDEKANLAQVNQKLQAAQASMPQITALLDARIAEVQVKADAFEARKAAVRKWAPQGGGLAELHDYIDAAGGFEGFAVGHWKSKAKDAAAAVKVSAAAVDKLKFGRPADAQALEKLEQSLDPVTHFTAELDAEMVKRGAGTYAQVAQGGHVVEMPSAWVHVRELAGDGSATLDVNLRNNGREPLLIGVRSGDQVVQQVLLWAEGTRASFPLEGFAGPLSFVVQGVGQPLPEQPADGEQLQVAQLDIRSAPLDGLQPNATRHVHPYHYTAAPDAPRGAVYAVADLPPNGSLSQQRAPGRPPAAD